MVPQHLRERERQSKKKRRRRTSQQPKTEKKRQRTTIRRRGRSLKGTKPNNISTPETKNTTQTNRHISRKNQQKTTHQSNKVSEECNCRVAGPMGRPALLGSHPGGPQYRGVQVPPTAGTAPGSAKASNNPNMRLIPQKLCPSTWPFLK